MNLPSLGPDNLKYDHNGNPVPQHDETTATIPVYAHDEIRVRLTEYPAGSGTLRIDIRRWQALTPEHGDGHYVPLKSNGINISTEALQPLEAALRATQKRLEALTETSG